MIKKSRKPYVLLTCNDRKQMNLMIIRLLHVRTLYSVYRDRVTM